MPLKKGSSEETIGENIAYKEAGRSKGGSGRGALVTWARSVSGMGKRSGGIEFSSQQALQSYLREHPKADMSNHSVAQPKQASKQTEQSSPAQAASQKAHSEDTPEAHRAAMNAHLEARNAAERAGNMNAATKHHEEMIKHRHGAEDATKHLERVQRTKDEFAAMDPQKKEQVLGGMRAISKDANKASQKILTVSKPTDKDLDHARDQAGKVMLALESLPHPAAIEAFRGVRAADRAAFEALRDQNKRAYKTAQTNLGQAVWEAGDIAARARA